MTRVTTALSILVGACASIDADPTDGDKSAVVSAEAVWPGGDLYLVDATGSWTTDVAEALRTAADELAAQTPLRIHFVADAADAPAGRAVRFGGQPWWLEYVQAGGGAVTAVFGQPAGEVDALGSDARDAYSNARATRHELGHLIGLAHTHQRVDRDEHVRIGVLPWLTFSAASYAENFDPLRHMTHIGPFDVESVMEYGPESGISQIPKCDDTGVCEPERGWFLDHYSSWDYTVISALYCDVRYCGSSCASLERCCSAGVQENLTRLYDWEHSEAASAWRAKYPGVMADPHAVRPDLATRCAAP